MLDTGRVRPSCSTTFRGRRRGREARDGAGSVVCCRAASARVVAPTARWATQLVGVAQLAVLPQEVEVHGRRLCRARNVRGTGGVGCEPQQGRPSASHCCSHLPTPLPWPRRTCHFTLSRVLQPGRPAILPSSPFCVPGDQRATPAAFFRLGAPSRWVVRVDGGVVTKVAA
jgi:hypothetical protein